MTIIEFIGLPYKSQGRTMAGVDCWGLVYLFYKDVLGIEIPSYVDEYSSAEHKTSVAEAITDNIPNWQKVETPEYGDVLVFNILGMPIHTAISIGGGDFIHSFKDTNSCIERLNSITWNKRLKGIYRWQIN